MLIMACDPILFLDSLIVVKPQINEIDDEWTGRFTCLWHVCDNFHLTIFKGKFFFFLSFSQLIIVGHESSAVKSESVYLVSLVYFSCVFLLLIALSVISFEIE